MMFFFPRSVRARPRWPVLVTLAGLTFTQAALTPVASAQPAAAKGLDASRLEATHLETTQLETTRQLLDWLGVDAIIEQTPAIAEQALASEGRFRKVSAAEQSDWRRRLAPRLNTTTLRERVVRGVAQSVDAPTLQQALTLLQMPLPRRARYFELAMAQPGSASGLKDFRTQFEATPNPARRQLARALVTAAGTAELLAQWQTAVSAAVMTTAGDSGSMAKLQDDAVKERALHLAPLAEAHALYTYRYLTDAELRTYRDTLGHAAIQKVLEVCRRNLAQAFNP